jgi:hypothetical protein
MTSTGRAPGPLEAVLDAALDRAQPSRPAAQEWSGLSRDQLAQLQACLARREASERARVKPRGRGAGRGTTSGRPGRVEAGAVAFGVLAIATAVALSVASQAPTPAPPRDALSLERRASPPQARLSSERASRERARVGQPAPTKVSGRVREVVSSAAMAAPAPRSPSLHAVAAASAGAGPESVSDSPVLRLAPEPSAGRRAREAVVTVHDAFGIGGDEPLPPAALGASTPGPRNRLSHADGRLPGEPPPAWLERRSPY